MNAALPIARLSSFDSVDAVRFPRGAPAFEVMGRIVVAAAYATEEEICRLDEDCFRRLWEGPVAIEMASEADGRLLVNWMNHCVRYGHSSWEDFLVSSSSLSSLADLRRCQPQLRTGLILDEARDAADGEAWLERLGSAGIACVVVGLSSPRALACALAARRRYRGLRVLVEPVNAPEEVQTALASGADGVISDHPGSIREAAAVTR